MDPLFEIARRHGLAVIEDAAHALPASDGSTPIGAIRGGIQHAVAFSFYATKNLTTGEGGMLTAAPELLAECRLWSLHGMSKDAWRRYDKGGSWKYEVIRPGFKCNMTDMQAALGLHQIDRLPSMQRRREEVSAEYERGLEGLPIETPTVRAGVSTARHLFVIRLDLDRLSIDRSQFIDELAARNIGTSVHFIPLHLHPYYRDKYGLQPTDFPIADREFTRMISLPLNARLTDTDVRDVIEAVRDVCESNGGA
jgi:dTDP-4-amino-4,6-dideoxygalactose transaminase